MMLPSPHLQFEIYAKPLLWHLDWSQPAHQALRLSHELLHADAVAISSLLLSSPVVCRGLVVASC